MHTLVSLQISLSPCSLIIQIPPNYLVAALSFRELETCSISEKLNQLLSQLLKYVCIYPFLALALAAWSWPTVEESVLKLIKLHHV